MVKGDHLVLLRRVVFYLFLALYLWVCPWTILYALGIILKPGAEKKILKTGLIYVSTLPKEAFVYVNEQLQASRTPTVIRNLLPGDYALRIEHPGFRAWKDVVPVEAEKASVIEKLILLPDKIKTIEHSTQAFDRLYPVPETPYLVLAKTQKLRDLEWVYTKKMVFRSIRDLLPSLNDSEILDEVMMRPRSKSVVICSVSDSKPRYVWLDLAHESVRDLSRWIPSDTLRVVWLPHEEDRLWILSEHGVYELRMDKKSIRRLPFRSVNGFGAVPRKLYALSSDGELRLCDWNGQEDKLLLKDDFLRNALFSDDQQYRIEALSDDIHIFWGQKGRLISNRFPYIFAKEGVRGWEYYARQKRLLVWTSTQIGLIDFNKPVDMENEFFEPGTRVVWVYSKGEMIRQACWVYHGAHVIFSDADRLFFLDLETFNETVPAELTSLLPGTQFSYIEDMGTVFFLDAVHGRLNSLEVVPQVEMELVPFPQRTEKLVKRKIMGL